MKVFKFIRMRHFQDSFTNRRFNEFYERSLPYAAAIIVKIMGKNGDTDDAIQDVYVGILQQKERFFALGREERKRYLAQVAANVAVKYLKKQGKAAGIPYDDEIGGGPSPESLIKVIDTGDYFRRIQAVLDDKSYLCLLLNKVLGYSCAEIATMSNESQRKIEKRVRSAIKIIKKKGIKP